MDTVLKVPDCYKPLYTSDKPIILITGGRASAKSFNASLFLKRLTYEKNHVILFARYTMTSAEKSVIPEFNDKIEREGDGKYFDVTVKEITNTLTGSRILFTGIKTSSGNQTANLKSIQGLTTFVGDEMEEWVNEDEFDKLRLSIRTQGVKNRVILILNPCDVEHWIYKRYIENSNRIEIIDGVEVEISTHPDIEHIHTTYLDNYEYLSKEFIKEVEQIKKEHPEKYAEKIIGAWARQKEGQLFQKEELKTYVPDPNIKFESSLAYADIADEGKDSTAIAFGRNIGSNIYITDVIFSKLTSEYTIPECVRKIKENQTSYIRVESNAMGAMYGRELRKEIGNYSCAVLPAQSTTNKIVRIVNDAYFIKKHFYFLAPEYQSNDYKLFMKEVFSFMKDGTSKHDDAPDSLSGLSHFVRNMFLNLYS
jgi:PBSX family phage terminase large subunit